MGKSWLASDIKMSRQIAKCDQGIEDGYDINSIHTWHNSGAKPGLLISDWQICFLIANKKNPID